MRQVTRKGLITVAAATGVLAATGGYAHADSGADGSSSDSPGVLAGNSVQLPVHVPLNVCGNTVNVVGVLNPAAGNKCANTSHGGGGGGGYGDDGGYGDNGGHHQSGGGSTAHGHTGDSPGVGSGNNVQLPIHAPVNVCGNSVTIGGLGNAAMGNECANDDGGTVTPPSGEKPPTGPEHPGKPEQPGNPGTPEQPVKPAHPGKPGQPGTPSSPQQVSPVDRAIPNQPGAQAVTPPEGTSQLASTGSELPLGLALPVGAGALIAGTVLYRRARATA
ncbi:chaplin family protein [Streptomyces sp. NPDC002564]|uniref:chaplin n=1 Tax=Streptomyces sp. NPDC002564 TaxID=3364649 RepID=UPI003694C606